MFPRETSPMQDVLNPSGSELIRRLQVIGLPLRMQWVISDSSKYQTVRAIEVNEYCGMQYFTLKLRRTTMGELKEHLELLGTQRFRKDKEMTIVFVAFET